MLHWLASTYGAQFKGALFANTGLEEPETLDFVAECSEHWGIPITWLEYRSGKSFAVVDRARASLDGTPFTALVIDKRRLPNPVQRFCTAELKVRTMRRYLQSQGVDLENDFCALGIRADEPRRAAKIKARFESGKDGCDLEPWLPLVPAGVTVQTVHDFWRGQAFGLRLASDGKRTFAGNCNLCFCKPYEQRLALIAEKPERAVWWVQQESFVAGKRTGRGRYFTKDTPPYAVLAERVARQNVLAFEPAVPQAVDCFCGDDA